MISIGDEVLFDARKVCVQDTDAIARCALVGMADNNGTVWITKWVPFHELTEIGDENV